MRVADTMEAYEERQAKKRAKQRQEADEEEKSEKEVSEEDVSDDESDSLEYLNTTYVPKQKPVKRQEESEIEISKHEELERNIDYEKTQAPYGPIWELLKKWEVIYKTKAEAETAATVELLGSSI